MTNKDLKPNHSNVLLFITKLCGLNTGHHITKLCGLNTGHHTGTQKENKHCEWFPPSFTDVCIHWCWITVLCLKAILIDVLYFNFCVSLFTSEKDRQLSEVVCHLSPT